MTPAEVVAEERELGRRAVRECQLMLALACGARLAPHEVEEAREARLRVAAALGVRL